MCGIALDLISLEWSSVHHSKAIDVAKAAPTASLHCSAGVKPLIFCLLLMDTVERCQYMRIKWSTEIRA